MLAMFKAIAVDSCPRSATFSYLWGKIVLHSYPQMQKEILIDLVTKKMPFGKYKGYLICDIPEHYLVWMQRQGFPEGKLGMWLHTMYEIRLNGLEEITRTLKSNFSRIGRP